MKQRIDRPFLWRLLRSAVPLLLLASPATATSYVMMEDGRLADQAAVVAEVRIDTAEPTPAGRIPGTAYLVAVERLVKGYTSGSSIVVRVPGGVRADGKGLKIWGAPEFRVGDRALLFLAEHADGTYGILHLMLGAFHAAEVGGRQVVLRNLTEATEVRSRPGGKLAEGTGEDRPRDLDRFSAWLADRANGTVRPADYFASLSKSALSQLTAKFTLFVDGSLNLRWFDFDSGQSVPFYANASGQPGVPGGGFTEFQRAITAWNSEPLTPIHYTYAGTTTATGGLKTYDGINAILFNDPNQEIDGTFSCDSGGGGILGVGGPWYDPTVTGRFNGKTFIQIQGADIITNDGIDCYFGLNANVSKAAEELFGHELGHTLGLAHSCGDSKSPACSTDPAKDDALMRTYIHGDGRGARLGADDLSGIRYLYAPGGAPTSGPCRPSGTTLCLDGKRFAVTLAWQNQFDGSSGVGRAVPATDVTGYFSFGDPSNLELLIKILDFGGGTFKVFYGELTNLHFTLTVTDTQTGTVKTYANTPGDCGGIDQSFLGTETAASTAGGRLAALTGRASGSCRPDATTLCLLSGRFAVRVHWSNPGDGTSGQGGANPLSSLVGTFFFTDRTNVELMTKVVPFADRVVFFYGALSDLSYTIQVTDTVDGAVKSYQSTARQLCGGLDNTAFPP